MLMSLGPIQFEVYPLNATQYGHDHESTFVEKPVLGTRPALEFVGEGAESWSISARIFPHKFGGLSDLKQLYQARAAGKPLYLMRGDGSQMGWVVIDQVSERSSYLDRNGVGKVIEVDISVRRSGKPSDGSFYSVFTGVYA